MNPASEMLNAYRMFIIMKKMAGVSTVSLRDLEIFELELRTYVEEE